MAFKLGGDYFSPAVGRYIGQFTGTADGPVQDYPASDGKPARKGNTIRWFFNLYNLDGSPVVDPKKPGEVAVAEGLSSDTIGVGRGTEAKARVWFRKMLESKGLQWVDPTTQAELEAIIETCKGTFVYLTFGPKKGQGVGTVISEMERLSPQPGAAPAPTPAPAATLVQQSLAPVVAQVVAPVAAPVSAVAAPLPVPVAAPFTPASLPATGIPSMPFPVAQ